MKSRSGRHSAASPSSSSWRRWALQRIRRDSALIVALQRWRSPWLDAVMTFISLFGHEIAFVVLPPVIVWNVNLHVTRRMVHVWLLVMYIGHALKDIWRLPRPRFVNDKVYCIESSYADEFGCPSTHSAAAAAMPVFFVWEFWRGYRMTGMFFFAEFCGFLYLFLISLSRVYLGVHSILDLLGGAMLGWLVAVVWACVGQYVDHFLVHHWMAVWVLPSVGGLALWLYPAMPGWSTTYRDTASIVGSGTGFVIANAYGLRRLPFWNSVASVTMGFAESIPQMTPGVTKGVIRTLLGIAILVAFHEVYKRFVLKMWTRAYIRVLRLRGKPVPSLSELHETYALMIPAKYFSYMGIGVNCIITVPWILSLLGLGVSPSVDPALL